MTDYGEFLEAKRSIHNDGGFKPLWEPDFLFDFQRDLVEWALLRGRAAIFADCGLGKTPMQLVWAENVARKTKKPTLILTPLAVSQQTIKEAEKFGIPASRSREGEMGAPIVVTNYERLHYFLPSDFGGVVCDESSILKNFDGATKAAVTEFMRTIQYRLLCTATAAPNDYIELGTSSEALGMMGHMDMLGYFFRNVENTSSHRITHRRHGDARFIESAGGAKVWRFKYHAEQPFWRWVSSWARALRKPSDLGYDDDGFILPPLNETETVIDCSRPIGGRLFAMKAVGLQEQREERRATIQERCEEVAAKVDHDKPALVWCHLNDEGDLLERLIPDSIQVKGAQTEAEKEERLTAFAEGRERVLVIKPKIGAFGLNFQHCSHVTLFPSHSYEQYYQGVRRCWRFGQKNPVAVDIVTTEGEIGVLHNLQRKSDAADAMFTELTAHMNDALHIEREDNFTEEEEVPVWL